MKTAGFFPEALLKDLGVLDWGYTEEALPRSFSKFSEWVDRGQSGPLTYLTDERRDSRSDLKSVYPDFQAALVFLFSYQDTKKWLLENSHHEVAAYSLAYGGEDYHQVLRRRLKVLELELKKKLPELSTYISLDAESVLERDLAHRAGLGWFGKNSMLIHQREGSYFLIGSLLLNQRLSIEQVTIDTDHCGQCNACVEACPTQAIDPETRTLHAEKCIATFTIELMKMADPPKGMENSRGEVFGCDICQDVCPWNTKPLQRTSAKIKLQERFEFVRDLFHAETFDELKMLLNYTTNRGFRKKFEGTVFDRPGRDGWFKNIRNLKKKYF
jgi:epoxyqueuosine reductase